MYVNIRCMCIQLHILLETVNVGSVVSFHLYNIKKYFHMCNCFSSHLIENGCLNSIFYQVYLKMMFTQLMLFGNIKKIYILDLDLLYLKSRSNTISFVFLFYFIIFFVLFVRVICNDFDYITCYTSVTCHQIPSIVQCQILILCTIS